MQTISSFDELRQIINIRVGSFNIRNPVISIDGQFQSGKTSLSIKLHDDLGYHLVNLDNPYLNTSFFEGNYEYDEYKKNGNSLFQHTDRLIEFIEQSDKPILLDGAYMENLISTARGIKRNLSIYIKKIAKPVGLAPKMWIDQDLCDFDDLEKILKSSKDVGVPLMREELIRYHHNFKPHLSADIIYENEHTEN